MGKRLLSDLSFQRDIATWIERQREVYVIVWYAQRAGMKRFILVRSIEQWAALTNEILTSGLRGEVIVFKQPQLPIRGIADEKLLQRAMAEISDGEEWMLISSDDQDPNNTSCCGGNTYQELKETWEEYRRRRIAIGIDVDWLAPDSEDVQSGSFDSKFEASSQ